MSDNSKIELPLLEYSKRKNCAVTECYLALEYRHIHYKIVATYLELNSETDIWEEKKANYRWCRPRHAISEVSMFFDNLESVYTVTIDFAGIPDGNSWMFESGKEALKIYETLKKYMVETPTQ